MSVTTKLALLVPYKSEGLKLILPIYTYSFNVRHTNENHTAHALLMSVLRWYSPTYVQWHNAAHSFFTNYVLQQI